MIGNITPVTTMFAFKISVFFLPLLLKNSYCLESWSPKNLQQKSFLDFIIFKIAEGLLCANETASPVHFHLFLPSSNETLLIGPNNASEYMNFAYPTKIFVHPSGNNAINPGAVEWAWRYHQKGHFNVISADWSVDAAKFYTEAVSVTPDIGYQIANFLVSLLQYSPSFLEDAHVIGHSLGAHIAGFAAKRITALTGKKIGRITSLDAAAPLFEYPIKRAPECRLDSTDAIFVDAMHTSRIFGTELPLSDQDFFVNHQFIQEGCTDSILKILALPYCNHVVAAAYYATTITNPQKYEALACGSHLSFILGLCDGNAKALMGAGATPNQTGTFYINIDGNGDVLKP